MKLTGIRVLDLSAFLPGPFLSLAMADHGAEVIKIEPPGGEHGRHIGPLDGDVDAAFAQAQETFAQVGGPTLSLGMSADWERAVRFGSTMVRLGTAIFGPRPAPERLPV